MDTERMVNPMGGGIQLKRTALALAVALLAGCVAESEPQADAASTNVPPEAAPRPDMNASLETAPSSEQAPEPDSADDEPASTNESTETESEGKEGEGGEGGKGCEGTTIDLSNDSCKNGEDGKP